MAIPTYDGLPIFGPAPIIITKANPCRWQINAFPGVHGREALAQGRSGGMSVATVILLADNPAALTAVELIWRTYELNQVACTLIDVAGDTYLNVVVVDFEPIEPIVSSRTYVSRISRITFEHFS